MNARDLSLPVLPATTDRPWMRLQAAGAPACTDCSVRQIALFAALDDEALPAALDHVHPLRLAAGDTLLRAGQRVESLYTVRRGLLRVERFTEAGERRIVRLVGAGSLVGAEALSETPARDDLVACTPVELCRLSRHLFPAHTEAGQALRLAVLGQAQRDLEAMTQAAMHFTRGPVRSRLLHLLALLARHADAEGVSWLPRRDEISDLLDITVPTASRQLSALREAGVVRVLSQHKLRIDAAAVRQALQAQALAD